MNIRGIFTILGLLLSMVCYGQQVELSAKHQAKLARITDKYEHALKYKKYHKKDSIHLAKKLKKVAKKQAKSQLSNQINTDIPTDSASLVSQAESMAKDKLSEQTGIDAPDITIDSTTTEQVKDTVIKEGEKLLNETDEIRALKGAEGDSGLSALTEQKEAIEKTQEELKQKAAEQKMKQQLTAKAKDFITENAQQISEVQSQMTDLKRKYASVPNSNDLSTATKRNSLKGEPLWERFFLGGNFNIIKTEPFTMDISPLLGYRINKAFEAGFTAIYRNQFGANTTSIQEYSVYGYGIFANHSFYKNYFAYLEGEKISSIPPLDVTKTRSWKETLLLGIGRKFKITKWLEMQAIIAVNLLHKNSDQLYSSPVVFKTGIRIKP